MAPSRGARAARLRGGGATNKKYKGFTDEERAAMKERARELKAEASKADGEKAVLAKIAEMPDPDRAMATRIHAIVKANAPALSPKTWYGMPAYANKEGKSSASSRPRTSSSRGARRSASTTRRTSTKAQCGRSPSPSGR
jgi:uncharacterized protein YdhG (YjbR/CyaY superfamily)